MSTELSKELAEQVDVELLACRVILAIKLLHESTGCGIKAAIEFVADRFDKLVIECPDRFQCDLKTYWDGFYS